MTDLVSIITPTYNCGRFIEETIRSVQAQTYANWEMIIVDDCSTDNTSEVVERLMKDDDRIRYYVNEHNSGAALTRNKALREAKGRWIAFLDSDDLWQPSKLMRQLEFMKANNYSFTYHEYDEIDEESKPLGVHVGGPKHIGQFGMTNFCWPGCLTVMYDQDKVGKVQIADIKKNNDYAMWLKAIKRADCHLMSETLASYRRRKGSISNHSYTELVKWHYMLFHDAEGQNPIVSLINTARNLLFGVYKKFTYVKKV